MNVSDFITQRRDKKEVAKSLEITPQWLHACYLKIAEQVTDFIFDYPQLGNSYRKRVGLTNYQVWVLEKLVALVKGGMKTWEMVHEVDGVIVFNEQLDVELSKESYLKEISQEVQTAVIVKQ